MGPSVHIFGYTQMRDNLSNIGNALIGVIYFWHEKNSQEKVKMDNLRILNLTPRRRPLFRFDKGG